MVDKEKYIFALQISDKDNVATLLQRATKGSLVTVKGQDNEIKLEALADIPKGHKIALKDICKGNHVIKYGEIIGMATQDIKRGDYVHVHNLDSIRGKMVIE